MVGGHLGLCDCAPARQHGLRVVPVVPQHFCTSAIYVPPEYSVFFRPQGSLAMMRLSQNGLNPMGQVSWFLPLGSRQHMQRMEESVTTPNRKVGNDVYLLLCFELALAVTVIYLGKFVTELSMVPMCRCQCSEHATLPLPLLAGYNSDQCLDE